MADEQNDQTLNQRIRDAAWKHMRTLNPPVVITPGRVWFRFYIRSAVHISPGDGLYYHVHDRARGDRSIISIAHYRTLAEARWFKKWAKAQARRANTTHRAINATGGATT